MGTRLSVNINKIATLRNSRGGELPSVITAAQTIIDAGAQGITIHPRADERHIKQSDIFDLATLLAPMRGEVEYNIEGDPRAELIDIVCEVRPHQCTLVPVRAGEVTSEAGWDPVLPPSELGKTVARLKAAAIRVSIFIDAKPDAVRWAAETGADRIELYTEPFAKAFAQGTEPAQRAFQLFQEAAEVAQQLGLGVNAGHDLDLSNLLLFRELQPLDEVSIGHALISDALYTGLDSVVRQYLDLLR